MYSILSNDLEKPKYDMHIEGVLLDSHNVVTPNIFGYGKSVRDIADLQYNIQAFEDFSENGMVRDKLSVSVHHNIPLFVVSKRVCQLFSEIIPNQCEFYSLNLLYDGQLISDYSIINVVKKVDCVNYSESDVDFESYDENEEGMGEIYTIDALVLDTSVIPPQLDLFLLGRSSEPVILFHDRLVQRIKQETFSGFIFCKPEEFQL